MSKYRVFHLDLDRDPENKESRFRAMMGDIKEAVEGGLYKEVAHLEAVDLERVFRLTNHVDEDWTEGEAISCVKSPCRSTSVGDIVMDEASKLHSCESFGWEELSEELASQFMSHLGSKIELLEPDPNASPEM